MKARCYLAPIATETPKTKKTPLALVGIEGVSKVLKKNDQAIGIYLKEGLSKSTQDTLPKEFGKGVSFD